MLLGVLAIAIGALVGIVHFVPFVAISYRRHGGLTFGRFALWAAFLVYFLAIWTYTLLPLPDPDAVRCVGVNLNLLEFVTDIRGAITRPGNTLTDPAVLQLVLNVILFVPLGFFLRVLGGRGILVALVVGLGLSAFIETTQLTGVWGLYPCAYRVFDVDDMLTNTTGALLGSILSLVLPKRMRGSEPSPDADDPRPVTKGRRFVGALCDLIGVVLLQGAVGVGVQAVSMYLLGNPATESAPVGGVLAFVVPALLWFVVVLATGRTIGDLAVQLRYRGGPVPAVFARILRFIGGIGGWMLLGAIPEWGGILGGVFALVWLILLLTTPHGRGLSGVISGQQLSDARADDLARSDAPA